MEKILKLGQYLKIKNSLVMHLMPPEDLKFSARFNKTKFFLKSWLSIVLLATAAIFFIWPFEHTIKTKTVGFIKQDLNIKKESSNSRMISNTKDLTILIEIPPQNSGLIKTGLPISLQIKTEHPDILRNIHGKIKTIAPKPLTLKVNIPYYEVIISMEKTIQPNNLKPYLIPSGAPITAEIQVSKLAYLVYLSKPLAKNLIKEITGREDFYP